MAFQIHKPGQGRYARISCGVLMALLAAYGCQALSGTLSDAGEFFSLFGNPVYYFQAVPLIVFLVLVVATVWLLNWPKFADFLIETEIEMGRVAWPTRRAVVGSSVVVIVTVLIMSFFLYGVDRLLLWLLQLVKLY